jgi:2-polyprenyl-6-methoxyphenol hydroxylase-like FAD-dependent oxidoreductase
VPASASLFSATRAVQACTIGTGSKQRVFTNATRAVQVGADGAGSTIRSTLVDLAPEVKANYLEEKPKNTRVYKAMVLQIPDGPDWPKDSSYSERSAGGRVLECLPTVEGASQGCIRPHQELHQVYCCS